jgi:glutamine amidotransferase
MTVIVDYGAGNIRSVVRAFERLGETATVSSDPDVVAKARRLILPGVGSFDAAMTGMKKSQLLPVLEEKVRKDGVPILGICLGLQIFTRGSEEGTLPGLGWIPGETRKFPVESSRKVPHIGWNNVVLSRPTYLFDNLPMNPSLYFVHSYYVSCDREEDILATSDYGRQFVSMAQVDNIFGVQFHPEKSAHLGLQLLVNFLRNT